MVSRSSGWPQNCYVQDDLDPFDLLPASPSVEHYVQLMKYQGPTQGGPLCYLSTLPDELPHQLSKLLKNTLYLITITIIEMVSLCSPVLPETPGTGWF